MSCSMMRAAIRAVREEMPPPLLLLRPPWMTLSCRIRPYSRRRSGPASAGTGSGSGAGTGGGDGGTGLGAASAPPRERVEASLRAAAEPEYPQELIDDDVEGTVTIKILVAADGSVEAVNVESSSGYRAMDQAAIAAGWRFQFNPGDNGQKSICKWIFHFHLN